MNHKKSHFNFKLEKTRESREQINTPITILIISYILNPHYFERQKALIYSEIEFGQINYLISHSQHNSHVFYSLLHVAKKHEFPQNKRSSIKCKSLI